MTTTNINQFSKITTSSPSFKVIVTGQVESASFPSTTNNLYCRYVISHGEDWNVTHGVISGLSQIAQWQQQQVHLLNLNSIMTTSSNQYNDNMENNTHYSPTFVWNFPIEISFQSTNAYGWPRLSLALYGLDFLGRDVVRGYGSVTIPPSPGEYHLLVDMYRPISGSFCHQVMNWIHGTLPEYYETKFTAQGEGRAMTRVVSEGNVKVLLNVTVVDMKRFGFVL
jgi:B9 domain-containing protein 1